MSLNTTDQRMTWESVNPHFETQLAQDTLPEPQRYETQQQIETEFGTHGSEQMLLPAEDAEYREMLSADPSHFHKITSQVDATPYEQGEHTPEIYFTQNRLQLGDQDPEVVPYEAQRQYPAAPSGMPTAPHPGQSGPSPGQRLTFTNHPFFSVLQLPHQLAQNQHHEYNYPQFPGNVERYQRFPENPTASRNPFTQPCAMHPFPIPSAVNPASPTVQTSTTVPPSGPEADANKRKPRTTPRAKTGKHKCFCGASFERPSALRAHNRIHSGDRPFECPLPSCPRNKGFSVESNMTRHVRAVHKDFDYEAWKVMRRQTKGEDGNRQAEGSSTGQN